jgi:hypothetical protein
MIAVELLDELRTIRRDFDWCYDGASQRIRGRLRAQSSAVLFDPISAVCFARTGIIFGETEWLRAAELLDLSHIDAGDLTAAANNNTRSGPGHQYVQNLRRRMIEDVALQAVDHEGSGWAGSIAGYIPTLRKKVQGTARS